MPPLQSLLSAAERIIPLRRARAVANRLLDCWYGLNSDKNVSLEEFGLAHAERVRYAPSSWFTLPRIARVVPFSKDDVFVDFGSGKGRQVVLAARQYPFKRVVGVEIAAELNEIAQANVTRNHRRLKCQHVELVTTDVLQYEIPRDMTVAYFYSPFTGEIFKSVIGRIGRSLEERADRRLWIVLQRPTYGLDAAELKVYQEPEDLLRATPWLQHVRSIPVKSRHWATEISVYRATNQ